MSGHRPPWGSEVRHFCAFCRALILGEELAVRLRRILALFAMIATSLGGVASVAVPASAAPGPAIGWVRCANLSPGDPAVDIRMTDADSPPTEFVQRIGHTLPVTLQQIR